MRAFPRTAALLSSLLLPAASEARDDAAWHVEPPILGKVHDSGKQKPSKDVSGIACAEASGFPRHCIVIDDNAQAAQAVTLEDGQIVGGATIPLLDADCNGYKLELDGEGVAFADGIFYVMGSHGIPRHPDDKGACAKAEEIEARRAAASQVFRVTLTGNGTASVTSPPLSLTAAIAAQPDLKAATTRSLDKNGLTIEGVAVVGDRLYAGFRGPVLPDDHRDHAAILSVSLKSLSPGAAPEGRLFELPLGAGTGVRDMAIYKDQILLLAGPMADAAGRYAIYLWDGKSDQATELLDLAQAGIEQDQKAEGLLFLDETPEAMRVLVLFDGKKNGAPMPLIIRKK